MTKKSVVARPGGDAFFAESIDIGVEMLYLCTKFGAFAPASGLPQAVSEVIKIYF